MSLLSSVEEARLGKALKGLLPKDKSFTSGQYLQMTSFVGVYGSSGARRVDMDTILTEAGFDTDRSLSSEARSPIIFSIDPFAAESDQKSDISVTDPSLRVFHH